MRSRSTVICHRSPSPMETPCPRPLLPRPFWPRWSAIASCANGMRYFLHMDWPLTTGTVHPSISPRCARGGPRHFIASHLPQSGIIPCPRSHLRSWTTKWWKLLRLGRLYQKTWQGDGWHIGKSVPSGTFPCTKLYIHVQRCTYKRGYKVDDATTET